MAAPATPAVPPVLTAPNGVVPPQPTVPPISFTGIGASLPSIQGGETPDTIYDDGAKVAISQIDSSTQTAIAGATLQERYYRDGIDFYTSVFGSLQSSYASTYSADRQLEAEVLRLNTVPTGDLTLQTLDLNNRLEIVQIQTAQAKYNTDQNYASEIYGINQRYIADVLATNNSLAAAKYGADQELAGKTFGATKNKDAAVITSTNDLNGQ